MASIADFREKINNISNYINQLENQLNTPEVAVSLLEKIPKLEGIAKELLNIQVMLGQKVELANLDEKESSDDKDKIRNKKQSEAYTELQGKIPKCQEAWQRCYQICIQTNILSLFQQFASASQNPSQNEVVFLQLKSKLELLKNNPSLRQDQKELINDTLKQTSQILNEISSKRAEKQKFFNECESFLKALNHEDPTAQEIFNALSQETQQAIFEKLGDSFHPLKVSSFCKKFSPETLKTALKDLMGIPETKTEIVPVSSSEIFNLASLDGLPQEILLKILSYLSSTDALRIHRTNKSFKQILDADIESLKKREKIIKGLYTIQALGNHNDTIKCLAIKDDLLFSGSLDRTIKIWDLKTKSCLATLKGHKDPIECIAIKDDLLFSGSRDNIIKIWDLKTKSCVATLEGHRGVINCLTIKDDLLISGSSDHKIKIWDLKMHTCLATLEGHKGWVQCITVKDDLLVSGSWDHTIKIWDLTTMSCLATLKGHTASVRCLTIKDDLLISSSIDATIKIWNFKMQSCVATLIGDPSMVTYLTIEGDLLISCSEHGINKIWDLTTMSCLATLKKQIPSSDCLTIKDDLLISGSWGTNTIKICNLNPPVSNGTIFSEVCIPYEAGYGRTLGYQSELAWGTTIPFSWTPEGWKGTVPLGKEFKLVIKHASGQVRWEKREENRKVDPKDLDSLSDLNNVEF
jgi:WD40 repeat protein